MPSLTMGNVGFSMKMDMVMEVVETAIRQAAAVTRSAYFADLYPDQFGLEKIRSLVLRMALELGGLTERASPEIVVTAAGFSGTAKFAFPETGTNLSVTAEAVHEVNPDAEAEVLDEVRLLAVKIESDFHGGREVTLDATALYEAVNAIIEGRPYSAAILDALHGLWSE